MAAPTSTSSTIGEPFQLFLGNTLSKKLFGNEAVYTSHNPDFPGYATVTAPAEGIHVWDLRNLHAVASYSVGEHVVFAAPTFSRFATEDGNKSVVSYAVLWSAPGTPEPDRGRIIWVIHQNLTGPKVAESRKAVVVVGDQLVRICGTGHDTVPLLLVSKNGGLALANAQANVKSRLDWPREREHLETFIFPRKSCSFVQDDTNSSSRVAVICCQTRRFLHVRVALLGTEIVLAGTCEIPVTKSTTGVKTGVLGVTCSPSGILSFIDFHGTWATYQLVSMNSSLVLTSVSENFCLQRFTVFGRVKPLVRDCFSVVSLGTSLVLLAALVEGTQNISLQVWDLSYGVLLTSQLTPVPPTLHLPHLSLTVADSGQILLSVSPPRKPEKGADPKRSSIFVVPVDSCLKSNLASALRKTALTAEWVVPRISRSQTSKEEDELAKIFSTVHASLGKNHAQRAEQTFLKRVESHSSKEAALGYEFVKKTLNIIFSPGSSTNYHYVPRITRCLLENAVVSTIMLNGRLITMLRERGDWENIMFALTTVSDISEDELMSSAKFLIDKQHRDENGMDIDTSEGYVPPFWSYLFACVSYTFSAAPMRLAIRKHLPDARDLVVILEILDNWIQGGTDYETEALFKSLATNTEMPSSKADSPPYPKVIVFLQALLDASFVALLQYQPAHDLLSRILSHIEPEISLTDSLEPLRGVLEPFVKAQLLKEKTGTSKESPAEWRRRRKQLEQRAGLDVGLYRLEELVI